MMKIDGEEKYSKSEERDDLKYLKKQTIQSIMKRNQIQDSDSNSNWMSM
jgi:hypothetical protein